MPQRTLALLLVDSRQSLTIDPSLYANQWSLSNCHWLPDSSRFEFNRGIKSYG
ncbi:MAG: hypothetical protein R3B96_12835 [Pirellulaceae bacterium]